jgi:site-specific DNA recombinase
MYVDKLDGKVDGAFFERMSAEWRAEQDRCLREIERHQAADQSYLEEGVRVLELAQNAQRLFEKQEPREKRRLLNFVVSNATWKGAKLAAKLRQPFDFLAETTTLAAKARGEKKSISPKSEIWLPGPDSNQRPTG